MNRRNFIKTVPALALATSALGNITQQTSAISYPTGTDHLALKYPYFVNCYIQNQRCWPLEEYKKGMFGGDHADIKDEGYMGDKWINGQLRFFGFGKAVEFIEIHSRVVQFEHEISYEVFHERSRNPLVPPKHIFNYWAKISPLKEIKWIHPDYIAYEEDGALIEYV
jgi:hypothetical protein|tara:strand:- start:176 stop:676 length:501 start_codon:yes stop_codon:yes gene_type:complete